MGLFSAPESGPFCMNFQLPKTIGFTERIAGQKMRNINAISEKPIINFPNHLIAGIGLHSYQSIKDFLNIRQNKRSCIQKQFQQTCNL